MEIATIIFSDGTQIEADVNGSCFIVDEEPEFPDNFENITIEDSGSERQISHGRLIECESVDGRYWFSIEEIPEGERILEEMQANMLYIAMMADIDLDS